MRGLALALALLWLAAAAAEVAVPPLEKRVTDLADLLPPDRERELEARLAAFEGETTHQIAVVTVPTLEGEPIESFALRVAEQWQLGQAELDNGMLLVIAAKDREARVEVGYGLEGVVPDAVANRVLDEVMIPRFRAGDFPGGIGAGVDALIRAARGEVIPAVKRPAPAARPRANVDPLPLVLMSGLLASFVSLPFRRASRPLAGFIGGSAAALLVWLLVGIALYAGFAFLLGAWFGVAGPMPMGGRRGGWGGGGFGRGGGFGGGGFRGGGGGFGGGGASGRW